MIDELSACTLICELARKIEARPAIALAFVDTARWATTALVVWNEYRYRSAWRSDKHIRLNGIRASQVIRSVNTASTRLKCLPRSIRLTVAASILDRDRALSYDVINISGMVMPRTRGLADRRFERSGCQRCRTVP